jgi:polar amino acid transport system substrate-binding protein
MRVPCVGWNRKARKLCTAALLLWMATVSLVLSAQTRQLRLVSTAWPPFTNGPGEPRFALELVEAALGRIGVTTTTTIVADGQLTPALLKGQFDGSAALWKDPERDRVLLFSQPYLENRLVLVGRAGSDVSATALADLKGRRIAIVEGYSYGNAVDNAGPIFVRSASEEDSLKLLLGSKVDYTLMDDLVVQYIVDHHANEARTRLQFGSTPLLTRPLYLAVRRDLPDAESIVNRFNAQLRDMIADRTYHRLLRLDWIRADVDGDGAVEYVPLSDRPGPLEPQRAYTLFSTEKQTSQPNDAVPRFLIGGGIYTGWAAVPEPYKVRDPQTPDKNHTAVPIYGFSW